VGKAHVPKHKLRTGTWVVLTGNEPLCMGGCGVCGILSAYVRILLLNIMPWRWSFPYRPSFFFQIQGIALESFSTSQKFLVSSPLRLPNAITEGTID
jgi:hypothetical protein